MSEATHKLVVKNIGLILSGMLEQPLFDGDCVVAIDGKIAAVGQLNGAEAARTVDCSGLCVSPGWVDTEAARRTMGGEEALRRIFATMPLRKIATPEDCAHAIVFLSSDRLAGHISGAILPVAGGMEGRVLHE